MCARHDPKWPGRQTVWDLESPPPYKRPNSAAGKWLSHPLRQKPLPVPAARRLDVVSMEIDVRSVKKKKAGQVFKIISVLKALYVSVTILTFLKVGWLFFWCRILKTVHKKGGSLRKLLPLVFWVQRLLCWVAL